MTPHTPLIEALKEILAECEGDFWACEHCSWQDNDATRHSNLYLLIKDKIAEYESRISTETTEPDAVLTETEQEVFDDALRASVKIVDPPQSPKAIRTEALEGLVVAAGEVLSSYDAYDSVSGGPIENLRGAVLSAMDSAND